jgi:Holliday junction resolvase RusA-like endonuclease
MTPLRNFKVHGNPVAQGRGRIVKRGAHYGIKDPEKSREYKDTLRLLAHAHRICPLPTGPLGLSLVFEIMRPKSVKKGSKWRDKTPDLDNLCKGVLDAFNGLLWADDKQVVVLHASKPYSDSPGVTVELWEEET